MKTTEQICSCCGIPGHDRRLCPDLPESQKTATRVRAERCLVEDRSLPIVFETTQITKHAGARSCVEALMRIRAATLRTRTAKLAENIGYINAINPNRTIYIAPTENT